MASKKIVTIQENTGTDSIQKRVNAFYADYPCTHASEAAWNKSIELACLYEKTTIGGRKPSGIAAAIVYTIARSHALPITQGNLASFYSITEVCLRNNRYFLQSKNIC